MQLLVSPVAVKAAIHNPQEHKACSCLIYEETPCVIAADKNQAAAIDDSVLAHLILCLR